MKSLVMVIASLGLLYPQIEATLECCTGNCASRGKPWPQDLTTPFPCSTASPIDIDSKKVNEFVVKPLYVVADVVEKLILQNTGKEVTITPAAGVHTGSYITGGIFGSDVYLYRNGIFYFAKNISNRFGKLENGYGTPLVIGMVHFNRKYGCMDAAVKHRDGTTMLIIGADVKPGAYNPGFAGFAKMLAEIVQPHTSYTTTGPVGAFLATYIVPNFLGPYYYMYPGSFTSENGTRYDCATILQTATRTVISTEQYKSFTNLIGANGKPLEDTLEIYPSCKRPVIKAFGPILIPGLSGLLPSLSPQNISSNILKILTGG